MPRPAILLATFLFGITGNAFAQFQPAETCPTYEHLAQQVRALRPEVTEAVIRGTYSTHHLFNTYSAGTEHVGGIAQLSDGRFALSHSTRSGKSEALMVFDNGTGDTKMLLVGNGNHPGGMQACGTIVVVPIYGGKITDGYSEVLFFDASSKTDPKELRHLRIDHPQGNANAAGIAYDPTEKRHYVIVNHNATYGPSNNYLYESNGKSLFDTAARFTRVYTVHATGSQGGTQLLYDYAEGLHVAALYRTANSEPETGVEHIVLSRIKRVGSSMTATVVAEVDLSDSGHGDNYSAGFRWGGTFSHSPTVAVFAVARTLTYGPAANYTKTKRWMQPGGLPWTPPFERFVLQTGTALHPTDDGWSFVPGDQDRDGKPDVLAIRRSGAQGRVEVHSLSAASNYQRFNLQTATPLSALDSTWELVSGDTDGDRLPDLIAIKKQVTGSGNTEVHILSAGSQFQRFSLQTATGLHLADSTWAFAAGDVDGDGRADVAAIKRQETGSGKTELHVLSAASDFQRFVVQVGTGLHYTGNDFDFGMADVDGDRRADLIAIKRSGESKKTEVHVLSAASSYQQFIVQAPSGLDPAGSHFSFAVSDWDGDGRPDLIVIIKSKTGTQTTEVHVLRG